MDLYEKKEHKVHQMAIALPRHRARIDALKQQLEDIQGAIETAEEACAWMEQTLAEHRPDLLPGADAYANLLSERLNNPDNQYQPFKARA